MSDLVLASGDTFMWYDGTTDMEFQSRLTGSEKIPKRYYVTRQVRQGIYELATRPFIQTGSVYKTVVGLRSAASFTIGSTVTRGSTESANIGPQSGKETVMNFIPTQLRTAKNITEFPTDVFDLLYSSE